MTESSRRIGRGSGRRELADWIASQDNPLTARVMANRVWLHLIGRGLVATPDNFGATGQPPSHPELLDYLALSFADNGWSVKKLIRSIVLSRAYQLSLAVRREESTRSIPTTCWSGGWQNGVWKPRPCATRCWPWPAGST